MIWLLEGHFEGAAEAERGADRKIKEEPVIKSREGHHGARGVCRKTRWVAFNTRSVNFTDFHF